MTSISTGLGLPMFIRGLSDTIKAKIEHYGYENTELGDILLTNDAYIMGSHLNLTSFFTAPIFREGKIAGFCVVDGVLARHRRRKARHHPRHLSGGPATGSSHDLQARRDRELTSIIRPVCPNSPRVISARRSPLSEPARCARRRYLERCSAAASTRASRSSPNRAIDCARRSRVDSRRRLRSRVLHGRRHQHDLDLRSRCEL